WKKPPRHASCRRRLLVSGQMDRKRSIVVFPLKAAYLSAMEFDRKESAAYLANLLAKAASRALQARADGAGFAPGQFPVLLELWSGDGLTQRELLDRLDIEQATMANTLARMQRDGLISRRRHPKDKRAQLVFLTGRGKALRETAMAAAS